MATQGYALIGVKTYMDNDIEIEQIVDIPLPDGKTGTIDLTNQDSGWTEEKIAGRFSANDITLKGIFASLPGQLALQAAFGDNQRHNFRMTLPDGTIVTFLATVGSFAIANEKEAEAFTVNLIVFGKATYSTSYAALTTFTIGTGGTLVPSASTPGDYVVVVTDSTTSVPVTAADTTVGSAIYVNGTANTSWPKSISTGVGITKTIIKVTETGKAPAYYNVTFARSV